MLTQHYCWGMLALLTMALLFSSVFQNVLFQTCTLIGWVVAICALLCFCPSLNQGVGLQINILTEVLVALGALLLLGSIVDLLCFQKLPWKTLLIWIASTMFRLFQNIVQNIVGQCFCQNITHPYQRVALPEKTNESSWILKQKVSQITYLTYEAGLVSISLKSSLVFDELKLSWRQ